MSIRLTLRVRCAGAALLSLVTLSSCGDDGPSGPSPDFSLVGSWQWQITNAVSGTVSCDVDDVTLLFIDDGGLAGGVVADGGDNITCRSGGVPSGSADLIINSDLDDLSHTGNAISFSFPTSAGTWQMSGTITSDNSMSGTGTIRLTNGGTVLALTGPWTASRN